MKVSLTAWEYKQCVDVATTRMSVSIANKITDINHEQRNYNKRLLVDILGACGEVAVAKAINRYWAPSVNTFHTIPDIAPNIEVRTTTNTSGSLIVRDNDPDDRYYFLVVGEPPNLEILGWIKGGEAKKESWKRNPHGHRASYFVPQNALTALKETSGE